MCEFCTVLNREKPFRFHRTDSSTNKILIGKKASAYVEDFESTIFPHAMNNSLMTAVIGQPGAGKTQLINFIEHYSTNDKNRACSILELKDKEIDYSSLIDHLGNDKRIYDYFSKYDYDLNKCRDNKCKINQIARAIKTIWGKNKNNDVGICLFVDAVDEYIRKINSYYGKNRQDIIRDLIGTMMFLLNSMPRLCIVFAITNDVVDEFKESLKDSSQGRRFKLVSDMDGNPLILDQFDEEETVEMVSTFMSTWSKKNGLTLPITPETMSKKGINLFPFTHEAINLIWRAGVVPGDSSIACLLALEQNMEHSNFNCQDPRHLIVKAGNAAIVIKQFSSYFINYKSMESELNSLLEENQIEDEFNKILFKAKKKHSVYSSVFPKAFMNYLSEVSKEFRYEIGGINKFVRHKYEILKEFTTIDLVLDYKNRAIGVQFIYDVLENNSGSQKRNILNKTRALMIALSNQQIERGLIVLLSKNGKEQYSNLKSIISQELKNPTYRYDYSYNLEADYSTSIELHHINEDDAWVISGLNDFFIVESEMKKKYYYYLEGKLQISILFKDLIEQKPRKLRSSEGLSVCGILDKAE